MAAALTTLQTPPSSVIASTTRFWSTFSAVMATLRRYWLTYRRRSTSLARASMRPAAETSARTTACWLDRNANDVAATLHVHPPTVRYRLRTLQRLFGDQLGDPESRFELEIALRALLAAPASP